MTVELISDVERAKWLRGLGEFDGPNTQAILAVFSVFGLPASYLDVGSGTGAMVRAAKRLGIDACGLDRLATPDVGPDCDLTAPVDLGRSYGLVTTIETAEHLPPSAADTFCDTLARHTMPGGVLVFTAAQPGQIGDGHVNCQPATYWREKLDARGLAYDALWTARLALVWSMTTGPMMHLPANLQVFHR